MNMLTAPANAQQPTLPYTWKKRGKWKKIPPTPPTTVCVPFTCGGKSV